MDKDNKISFEILEHFQISSPVFIEKTQIATIWKVTQSIGGYAALKLYDNRDMKNESAGFPFLQSLNGMASAKIYAIRKGEALMEWLDGPSLGDLTRSGQDKIANTELIKVANLIHRAPLDIKTELPKIESLFEALFQLQFHQTCPTSVHSDLLYCKEVARDLLATQVDVRPLHGDLHHDNIRLGQRGYCAFDAKGVMGERAYELANAFRNPKDAVDIVQDPQRVLYLAETWSQGFGVDQQRLLKWAMVKCALSIAWRSKGMLENDPELPLLSLLRVNQIS
ncbi:MAG: aminoglycoside phosphotransferase family protein [Rhizobiaceae bacterium]